jgi:hypothetical protein
MKCLEQWAGRSQNCPLCRKEMIDQVHVAEFIAHAEGPEALLKEHQNLLSNDLMR